MGRPKALLPFGEETCLSLVLRACREGGAAAPVVVLGYQADRIRAALPEGVRMAENPSFQQTGPCASLQAGLRLMPPESKAFLIFPVDFPLVTGAVVRRLLERWDAACGVGVSIVVPSHDGRRGHPALFAAPLAAEFLRLAPDAPMHQVLRSRTSEIDHVPEEDAAVVMDMDTPEDYRRCLEAWEERQA